MTRTPTTGSAARLKQRGPSERPLRVLHVIDGLGPGGAETLLYGLIRRPSAVEHEVVCLGKNDWYSGRIKEHGVQVRHLGKSSYGLAPAAVVELTRLVERSKPDVVQAWLYRSNVLSGIAGRISGVPVVWGIHCSSLEPLTRFARLSVYLSGALARWLPDFIINCSTRSAELHGRLGYDAAPGAVVHNGYDPDVFYPDDEAREALRNALGTTPGTFVIGAIGRWHPQKDLPNLLRAIRIASERGVPVRCLLIGRELAVLNFDLGREIQKLGCGGLVLRLGERPDIKELARAMDLHVLASCGAEAFPNVVAETMLSGTPNAVTDVGDSSLMVGDTGWVVPPRDPEKLADAIVAAYGEWKDEPDKWKRRRKAARERIADNFTLDRMAEAYEEVWRKVARSAPAQDNAPERVTEKKKQRDVQPRLP